MVDTTVTWQGTLTAATSIAHGGETRGTITFLRREQILTADGNRVLVPVISGNALRGRLRRTGEELLRDVLQYEGLLSAPAAHALRGGGSLARTGREPLSGPRLARLRALVPQIGVFGAAGGGTIIDGCLEVGKLYPHVTETARVTGVESAVSAFAATQLETYARIDDAGSHDFDPVVTTVDLDDDGTPAPAADLGTGRQMQFSVETFPAGTVFSARLRLRRPTPLELSFFVDVLAGFARAGSLGGRSGIGHGAVQVDLQHSPAELALVDWRTECRQRRAEILEALQDVT